MEIDPTKTAVLGLHWQANVNRPEGFFGSWFAEPVAKSGVINQTARVFEAARSAGIPVVYTRFVVPPGGGQLVRNTATMEQVADSDMFAPDAPTVEIIPELAPDEGDIVVDNQKLGGLSGSDLAERLRERGIDTLVITGVATNLTVESTARHGVDLGFRVYVLSDCVTTVTPEAHEASLANLAASTTGVVTSDEFISALRGDPDSPTGG